MLLLFCSVMSDSWDFPGKSTGVGCDFLLWGFSWPRDRTHISCVSRWNLYHWATIPSTLSSSLLFPAELCRSVSSGPLRSSTQLDLLQLPFRKAKVVLIASRCYSVTTSCLTLCDPKDCSLPGFPVLHYLLEFAQTHVYWVSDAIQPSRHLSPSSPALNIF